MGSVRTDWIPRRREHLTAPALDGAGECQSGHTRRRLDRFGGASRAVGLSPRTYHTPGMRLVSFSDWYLAIVPILVGAGMLGFWAVAVATRRIPEIEAGGFEIWFHIVAEVVTSIVLIAGDVAVLSDGDTLFAIVLSSLGLGMLTYSSSCGPATTSSAETWP